MIYILWLMMAFSEGPEPMDVKPGDPVLDIDITDLDQRSFKLYQVLDSSMCFILSLDCSHCTKALPIISQSFAANHHTAILFVDAQEKVRGFLEEADLPREIDVYLVRAEALQPHRIKTLPALLGYRHGHLKLAFHGPLDQKKADWLLRMYEKKYRKPNQK